MFAVNSGFECRMAACPHDQTPASMNDVLVQGALAAAQMQSLVDMNTLPPLGQTPPGLYGHGLAAPLGPIQ